MTPRDLRNIHTTGNSCRDKHGTKNTTVFLPADGQASWLLLPRFPYPLGDRSGLRKPKEDKHKL